MYKNRMTMCLAVFALGGCWLGSIGSAYAGDCEALSDHSKFLSESDRDVEKSRGFFQRRDINIPFVVLSKFATSRTSTGQVCVRYEFWNKSKSPIELFRWPEVGIFRITTNIKPNHRVMKIAKFANQLNRPSKRLSKIFAFEKNKASVNILVAQSVSPTPIEPNFKTSFLFQTGAVWMRAPNHVTEKLVLAYRQPRNANSFSAIETIYKFNNLYFKYTSTIRFDAKKRIFFSVFRQESSIDTKNISLLAPGVSAIRAAAKEKQINYSSIYTAANAPTSKPINLDQKGSISYRFNFDPDKKFQYFINIQKILITSKIFSGCLSVYTFGPIPVSDLNLQCPK